MINETLLNIKKLCLENNNLYSLEVDLTYNCNCDCVFCFEGSSHNSSNELKIEDYNKLFKEAKKLGCHYIGFSGGEPFLKKDVLKILNLAKDYGYRCSLITNGTMVSYETLDYLKEICFDRISFSIHSLDENKNKLIFGSSSISAIHTINLVKYCIKIGLNVGVCLSINKYNVEELDDFVDFFIKIGVPKNKISLNQLVSGKKDIIALKPETKQLLNSNHFLEQRCSNEDIFNSFLCSAGKLTCSVSPNGEVLPCTFLNCSAGNINEKSIIDIWNKSHLLKIFRSFSENDFEKCNKCNIKNKCHVCYANNISLADNCFEPDENYCAYMEEIYNG